MKHYLYLKALKSPLAMILLVVLTVPAYTQVPPKVNVSQLAFMAGTWTLHHQWGDMEEYWGPPMGNNMISSYRCVKDGKIVFYEFVVIEQTNNVPVMQMRHFNPGNIGWEEKDKPLTYQLVALTSNTATFLSANKQVKLSYQRLSPVKLTVVLHEKNKQGVWQTDTFNYSLKQ